MMAYERSESAWDNFGKFIHQFQHETKTLIRKLERIVIKLYRQNVFSLFNLTCLNERLLPNHTHTHTHTYIYSNVCILLSTSANIHSLSLSPSLSLSLSLFKIFSSRIYHLSISISVCSLIHYISLSICIYLSIYSFLSFFLSIYLFFCEYIYIYIYMEKWYILAMIKDDKDKWKS